MAKVLQYADLNKKVKDLLTKEYVSDVKFEVKTKTESGVSFNTTGTRSDSGFTGEFEGKFTAGSVNVSHKLDTRNASKTEISSEASAVLGGKLSLEVNSKNNNPESVKTIFQLAKESFSTNLSVDVLKQNVGASAVLGYEGWSVGGDFEYQARSGNVSKTDFTAAYTGKDFTFAAVYADKGNTNKFTYFHCLAKAFPSGAAVAGEYVVKRDVSSQSLTVGGHFNLDKTTFVKAKVSTDGNLNLLFSNKIHPNVTLTVGSTIETQRLKEADSQKVAFGLVFSDN